MAEAGQRRTKGGKRVLLAAAVGLWNGYKPLVLGQRLKALAFASFKPLCF